MGSTKIAVAVLAMAFLGGLSGCTMRTQARVPPPADDFSERDAYGQSFAASPTYTGQDTSWTTTAPARTVGGSWEEKAAAIDLASAKAKGAEEGGDGKISLGSPDEAPAAAPPKAAPRAAPRPPATPAQGGQSPAGPVTGAFGR